MKDTGPQRTSRYIIRRIHTAHCKRGPLVCTKCREMDVERICLLDICPPGQGLEQRRVIEIGDGSETAWYEFDVVQTFEDEQRALAYALENGVEDVEL